MLARKILILLICSFIAMAGCAKENIVFHDSQSHSIPLSHMKNKWLIIAYWASWCSTCRKEIPTFNQFYEHNHDKNILFYGVNYDQLPTNDLKQAISLLNIRFPVLVEDPNRVWQLGDITAVPTIFIINPAGQVVNKLVGAVSEQTLLDAIQKTP